MISSLINPASVARAGAFGRSDEYIFYVTIGDAAPQRLRLNREWVSGKGRTHTGNIRWDLLRRSGEGAARKDAPGCFYAIYINPIGPTVERVGAPIPEGQSSPQPLEGFVPVLPIRKDGSEGRWQWAPDTFRDRLRQGRVRITGSLTRGFVVSILKDGEYAKIERGEFQEVGRKPDGSILVDDIDTEFVQALPSSQWRISSHDATQYGSRLLADILPGRKFPFPKSLYAVRDTIRFFVEDKPNALVVDFFAGSGTTLHAMNLLNSTDGGQRRCILVTNNEVSAEEAEILGGRGLQPGNEGWDVEGHLPVGYLAALQVNHSWSSRRRYGAFRRILDRQDGRKRKGTQLYPDRFCRTNRFEYYCEEEAGGGDDRRSAANIGNGSVPFHRLRRPQS